MAEQDIQIPDEENMTPELSQEIAGLTGTDRAALLALLMAETQAADVVSLLRPKEVSALGKAMVNIQDTSPEAVNYVLDQFLKELKAQTSLGFGGTEYVENVFESYVAIKVARVEEPELIQGEPEGESIEDLFLDDETKEKLKSSSLPKIEELRIWVQRYNEQGRSVGGQAPVTLRRYESLKNGTPNRWYISFGFPF